MTLEHLQSLSNEELNKLAAIKVMGWEPNDKDYVEWYITGKKNVDAKYWKPTEDMNDATRLFTIMIEYQSNRYSDATITYPWCVVAGWNVNHEDDESAWRIHVEDDSLPRAITIASILAKGSE